MAKNYRAYRKHTLTRKLSNGLMEIAALPYDTLRPKDVATYLHACPNTICNSAKDGILPWAYRLGTRTVIPKEAFIHYHKYGQTVVSRNPFAKIGQNA